MFEGAVFDVDGTLLDSMGMWNNIGAEYISSLGFEPENDINEKFITMSLYQTACYYKKNYNPPLSVEELMRGVNAAVEDYYFSKVQLKPGARELLEFLSAGGVKMCVASATDEYLITKAFKRCGVSEYFSGIFTCTSVNSDKNTPLIYRMALESLGTDKYRTVVFEDAYHAIRTAKNDGFTTVGVFDPYEKNPEGVKRCSDFYLMNYNDLDYFREFSLRY